MLSLLVWNNIDIIHSTHADRLRDTANSMMQQIANTSGKDMVAVDYASLENYLSNIINYKELHYIAITDRSGDTVITLGLNVSVATLVIDKYPGDVKDGIFDIAQDIRVAGQTMGRIYMGFSLSLMDDAINKSRNRGITIAMIEIILTIIVTIGIGLRLTRRLSTLSIAAGEVEAGNYSVSVPTEVNDEVGTTAAAFNRMVTEVSNRNQQLEDEQIKTQKLLTENRQLIHTSLDVQEEERKDMARELHDELGQCLTAIQADAELIKDISQNSDTKIQTSAEAIMNTSSHVYDVVHSMMHRLRPSILDNLGLIEALIDEVDAWNNRNSGMSCYFTYQGELSNLGERINISIYRIIQECLTNVIKHSNAKHVRIKLSKTDNRLNLTIVDDGAGFNAKKTQRIGLGLIGMRERIQALKGTFSYETSIDDGFRILIYILVDNSE